MKKTTFVVTILIALFFVAPNSVKAQNSYDITFKSGALTDAQYYIGQHFRDTFVIIDSAVAKNGTARFARTKKTLPRGVYTLIDPTKKKKMFDFMVDDSRNFTITFDGTYSNKGMTVKGSQANTLMYSYMTKHDWANERAKEIRERLKVESTKEAAQKDMDALSEEMKNFENDFFAKNSKLLFTQLVEMFSNIDVPEALPAGATTTDLREWQVQYFRSHYWDKVDLKDHSLIYTPQLFDKMNYYFFGVLYHQEADTITYYAHKVLDRVADDSTMLRYFLDFILPRYERSTKNIGWDQVFVNLTRDYYLSGKCPWATEADLYSRGLTVDFLSQSLIGAMGQELIMADTNQSQNPADWISSHALPQKYVMLWFWDPDCNHCRKQTAELKVLYDSLSQAGNKVFEVYAVGYESDVNKWKKYVRDHKLPFINVGGANVNIDYQEAYNVHGAPTMILLNADRQIIMNKTIATNMVLPFLRQYEEKHPEQANRGPSRWQMEGIRRAKTH